MMLITLAMFAQSNLYWNMTVKVKMDKKLEYEKKLVAFVKTHYPNLKYRAYEVLTGENTGSYVFVMGPMAYKDLDVPPVFPKGEALMKTDGQGLDALCESTQVVYSSRQDDLSTMKADRKLKYLLVSSAENRIGTWGDIRDYLLKMKDARTKGGSTMDIDIHRPANGGMVNSITSVRFCETMAELDNQEDLDAMYDKVNGPNSYFKAWNNYLSMLNSIRSELRVLRPDLSQM